MGKSGLRIAAISIVIVSSLLACGRDPDTEQAAKKIPITTTSEEARSAYLRGRELIEALRFTDAHQFFVEATELDPDFALAWMSVANTAPNTHEFFAAMRHAEAGAGSASDGEQMLIRAFSAAVDGEPDIQRAQLQTLVVAYPGDERAHNTYANFLFAQQELEKAIVEYRKALAIDPSFSQPYNQLGYALRFLGDFEAAEKAFVRYIELIPDQPNPYDSYAEMLMKMGRFEDSIESYQKALSIEPTFIASYVGIAHNLLFMDRPSEARATIEKIGDVARNTGEMRQMCTWTAASYLYQDDFDGAIAEVQRRFDLAAENADRLALSGDINLMGEILLRAGRTEEAAAKFEESVEMMEISDATDEIKETVRRNHTYDLARIALLNDELVLARNLAATYRDAVAVHNVLFEVQQSRELEGMVALASGKPKHALFELANANQRNPRVLMLDARVFATLGDADGARAACRQVVDFNRPNFNLAFVRNTARAMLEDLRR